MTKHLISFGILLPMLSLFAQQKRSSCDTPEARQFDFWLGEWTVEANGVQAGSSRITHLLGDCVIFEEWSGEKGYNGKSFNFYNKSIHEWEQFWIDNQAQPLHLTGGYADGKTILQGESTNKGVMMQNRITWHNNDDGTVRQVWEQSKAGESWRTIFDGLYRHH